MWHQRMTALAPRGEKANGVSIRYCAIWRKSGGKRKRKKSGENLSGSEKRAHVGENKAAKRKIISMAARSGGMVAARKHQASSDHQARQRSSSI